MLRATMHLLLPILIFTFQLAGAKHLNPDKSQNFNDSNMKTVPFFDVQSTDRLSRDMIFFTAVVKIAAEQSAEQGGIHLELNLRYEGDHVIKIHNPIYFLQYILKGSDETQLFNGGKPPIPLINRKGPINEADDFNFNILSIRKNGKSMNIREQVNYPSVPFQKGDVQSYELQISNYLSKQTGQFEEIPQGIFHLDLLVSIIKADSVGDDRQSRTMKAQGIELSFK